MDNNDRNIYESYKETINEGINLKQINTIAKFANAMEKIDMGLLKSIMHGPGGGVEGDKGMGGSKFEDEIKQPKFVTMHFQENGIQAQISMKVMDYDDKWQKSDYYIHFDGSKIDNADF